MSVFLKFQQSHNPIINTAATCLCDGFWSSTPLAVTPREVTESFLTILHPVSEPPSALLTISESSNATPIAWYLAGTLVGSIASKSRGRAADV